MGKKWRKKEGEGEGRAVEGKGHPSPFFFAKRSPPVIIRVINGN